MNKICNKIRLFLGVALLTMTACSPSDEGPSVDDFFLNYDIPKITPTVNIPVGAIYANLGRTGITDERYTRLIGEYVADGEFPQLCPHVRPVLGHYKMDLTTSETAELVQQHIDWAHEAGINFFILPAIRLNTNAATANFLQEASVTFTNYLAGLDVNSAGLIDWGNLRYALSMTMDDFTNGLSATVRIEDDADEHGVSMCCEKLYGFFVELAERFFVNNDLYYEVDGKPMLVIWNAYKLISKDSKKLYDTIRQRVYEATGKEIYLVARQQSWTPPARFHYTFMSGGVDAVYMDNMYNQMDWARYYSYPQYINENFKYNRVYDMENYQVDFIPSVTPSYNAWMWNGTDRYNVPISFKDENRFREMCNVAKLNLGQHPMVIIDSFNQWDSDQAIEPTDPNYGNGYGMKYLEILKDEFKVK